MQESLGNWIEVKTVKMNRHFQESHAKTSQKCCLSGNCGEIRIKKIQLLFT